MSLSVPSRRLLRGAPALATTPTTTTSSLVPALQSLTLSPNHPNTPARGMHTTPCNQWFWNRDKKNEAPAGSIEQQVSGTQTSRQKLLKALNNKPLEGPAIFEDELKDTAGRAGPAAAGQDGAARQSATGLSLAREHLARAADPDPRARVRWERKMVIRQVQRGTDPYSREPRAARIARTERQLTSRSPFMATSTKKLVHLARQLQGKTVAEALVQMRFSKKKFAQEVRYHLEEARDLALVERGMGLGSKNEDGSSDGNGSGSGKPLEIQTKDGKWVKVDDPTRMYVAEAWVNRGGLRGKVAEYRARGRVNIQLQRSASISVVLKEEKTRIREAAEREAKKLRQGPWVHLPNRPVSAQRQWYSW